VVADMFGLAIRTYQKKVQRLTESVTVRDRTLWEAVLERLQSAGAASRRELLDHFDRDDPVVVGSVLNDLVSTGLGLVPTHAPRSQLTSERQQIAASGALCAR
jgi:hypothetical protein